MQMCGNGGACSAMVPYLRHGSILTQFEALLRARVFIAAFLVVGDGFSSLPRRLYFDMRSTSATTAASMLRAKSGKYATNSVSDIPKIVSVYHF